MAHSKGLDLILIKKALNLYEDAVTKNEDVTDLDFSVIYRILAEKTK